jgi:hypothetical protein
VDLFISRITSGDRIPQETGRHNRPAVYPLRGAVFRGAPAIAGGIAEAYFGIPEELKERVWDYLPQPLAEICRRFEE